MCSYIFIYVLISIDVLYIYTRIICEHMLRDKHVIQVNGHTRTAQSVNRKYNDSKRMHSYMEMHVNTAVTWTVQSISPQKNSLHCNLRQPASGSQLSYGPAVNPFLAECQYMDHQSFYFWEECL